MANIPQDTLVQRFEDHTNFINKAIERTENGLPVDLTHLTREADRLCNEAKNSDAETLSVIKPMMAEQIARLDLLALQLAEHKQKLINGH